jgi:LPS sulfotransferase NodH
MIVRRGENPDKIDNEKMKTILENHLRDINAWLQEQDHIERIDMPYKEIVHDPQPYVEEIARFLGRTLDLDSMIHTVEPKLYRQRK